jgi:hypothetical protein
MSLNREQLIAQAKPKVINVAVPEWGGDVFLRDITAGQRDQYDGFQIDQQGSAKYANFRARLLVLSLCDSEGVRLFGDGDVGVVSALPAQTIDRLWEQAAVLCGLKAEEVEKK